MKEQRWLVVRCPSCLRCTGQRSIPRSCTLCGQPLPRETEVVSEVESAALLQRAVALANTPEGLRDELAFRIGVGHEDANRDTSASATMMALRKAARGETISAEEVQRVLRSLNVQTPPTEFMALVEHEGLVLRLGHDRWQFIE